VASYFGLPLWRVKYLKRSLRLTHERGERAAELPLCEELQSIWEDCPGVTIDQVAPLLGVGRSTLYNHCRAIGFDTRDKYSDHEVCEALGLLREQGWCTETGVTFVMPRLFQYFGITARPSQIRRCQRMNDPVGHAERAATTSKTRYVYRVKGPRSLYHCDAHEKVAKVWGFWFHLCIDGYSRYIIYLKVASNKRAATVCSIFVEACNEYGWASRVRWDKGTENTAAAREQIRHWWDPTQSDVWNTNRGSALTGRS